MGTKKKKDREKPLTQAERALLWAAKQGDSPMSESVLHSDKGEQRHNLDDAASPGELVDAVFAQIIQTLESLEKRVASIEEQVGLFVPFVDNEGNESDGENPGTRQAVKRDDASGVGYVVRNGDDNDDVNN